MSETGEKIQELVKKLSTLETDIKNAIKERDEAVAQCKFLEDKITDIEGWLP